MFDRRGFLKSITAGATAAELADEVLKAKPLEPFNPKLPLKKNGQIDINALIGQMVDRNTAAVFDRIRFSRGIEWRRLNFFQVPVGLICPYSGKPKGSSDTNMRGAGMFDPPYDLIVKRIGFVLVSESFQKRLNAHADFEFRILQKVFREGPLIFKDGVAFYDFEKGFEKYIPPLTNFELSVNLNELAQGEDEYFDLIGTLTGLQDRPVQ